MSYIAPSTNIALLKNVPLDVSYDHTITFSNATTQFAYFRGKVSANEGRIFSLNSYQRTSRNRIRLELTMAEAIQYNYLYFQNASFENKFFYAFITNWEYINNATTEITYQIDVMQSFMFDYTLKQCFIEREHSNTDVIGDNLVPETLEQGDYIVDGIWDLSPYARANICNANASAIFYCTFSEDTTTTPPTYSQFTGGFANYVYTGLLPIKKSSLAEINTFINNVIDAGKLDGIIAAYMCPYEPLTYDPIQWDYQIPFRTAALAGYVPKNKKLFTYPYNFLRVRCDSDSTEYHYEYFSGSACEFTLEGYILPEPTLTLIPKNYNCSNPRNYCIENRLTIKEFPQIAIDADVWKVYFAQHGASLVTSMIGQTVETGAKLLALSQGGLVAGSQYPDFSAGKMLNSASHAGNMSGTSVDPVSTLQGASSLTGIATSLAQIYELQKKPPELKGTQTSLADYAIGAKKFYADYMCIRPEFAKIIDDYFTMFGYATHEVKVPNVHGRPYFNYVQTKACILEANVPEIYKQQIINIFNRGITFWHTENLTYVADIDNLVGNYSVNNSPA